MHRNEVVLAGRLSKEPEDRELPSGALLTQWRLAVRRPAGHPGYQRSDAIECATFDDGVRDMLADWRLDDLIEVEGALRRRWWRGGSRYEVEVRTARRVEQAPPRRSRRSVRHAGGDRGMTGSETDDAGPPPETAVAGPGEEGVDPAAGVIDDHADAARRGAWTTRWSPSWRGRRPEPSEWVVSRRRRSA